jgi:hypothetical protein
MDLVLRLDPISNTIKVYSENTALAEARRMSEREVANLDGYTAPEVRIAEDPNPLDNDRSAAPKSPRLAMGLSLGSTLFLGGVGTGLMFSDGGTAGVVLIGIGLTLGPSMGHFYLGNLGRGLLFSLGRAGAIALGAYGFVSAFICGDSGDSDDRSPCTPARFLLPIGGVALVLLTVWEIALVYRSAPEAYKDPEERSVSIAPWVLPPARRSSGKSPGLGLALGMRF